MDLSRLMICLHSMHRFDSEALVVGMCDDVFVCYMSYPCSIERIL